MNYSNTFTSYLSLKKKVTANPKLWFSLRLAYTKKRGELEDGLHKDQLNLANSEQCIKFGHLLRPVAMSNPLSGCHASRVFAMPPKKLGLIPDGLTMSIQNCIVSKQVTIKNK